MWRESGLGLCQMTLLPGRNDGLENPRTNTSFFLFFFCHLLETVMGRYEGFVQVVGPVGMKKAPWARAPSPDYTVLYASLSFS